jgi:hypothetical protein
MHFVTHDRGEGLADARGLRIDFAAEKGLDRDSHGQAHHFSRNVEDCTILPGLDVREAFFDHCSGITDDASAVECGLRKTALAAPEFAITGQQTFSQDSGGDPAHQFGLVELVLFEDQQLFDEIRAVEKNAPLTEAKRDVGDVAVVARDMGEEFQGIAAKLERDTQERYPARSGWQAFLGVCHWLDRFQRSP